MDHTGVDDLRCDSGRVAAMFDRIAGRYDLMNTLMTVGLDRLWRRRAALQTALHPGDEALDACCGTGDLSFAIARCFPRVTVVGIDASERMLARAEARRAGAAADRVSFVHGDVMHTDFESERFAAATAAFGVRNLPDVSRAFAELRRVTRPGGRLVCLEITTPPAGLWRRFHSFWFDRLVPLLGWVVAGDGAAYSYLPASVRAFPSADGVARLLHGAGWRRIRYRRMGLGIVALHVAERPLVDPSPGASGERRAAIETAGSHGR